MGLSLLITFCGFTSVAGYVKTGFILILFFLRTRNSTIFRNCVKPLLCVRCGLFGFVFQI